MMDKRLAKVLSVAGVFVGALVLPAVAFAQQTTAAASSTSAWQFGAAKVLSAGLAMSVSALSAAYAQAKIGSAGAGTLAERPDSAIWVITLQALPEIIVLLGFVSAIMISTVK